MQARAALKRGRTAPEAILHPASRSLFGYWNWLRAGRSAPCRRDIDLRPLAPILPWLGIMEREPDLRCHRWRLAGTGIARLWGRGLTGQQVAADWPDVYRRALVRALDGVCERQQPFVARLKAVSADGDALGIELFAATVEAAEGGAFQALCTVVPFREPLWLGRVPLVDIELTTLTAIWLAPLPDEIRLGRRGSRGSLPLKLIRGGRDG